MVTSAIGQANGGYSIAIDGGGQNTHRNQGWSANISSDYNQGFAAFVTGANNQGVSLGAQGVGSAGVSVGVVANDGNTELIANGTGTVTIQRGPTKKLAFFGVAGVAQQATPVTLGDVIALLQAYGLSA